MKPRPLQRLILAAHASELTHFAGLGRKYLKIEGDTAYLAAGVGPVAASFGLTHFLEDYRPKKILVIGTAGVIDTGKFKIGDVIQVSEIATASRFAETYTPGSQNSMIKLSGFRNENRKNRTAPLKAAVYCPQEITRSEAWRKRLASEGHEIENLESFAFAFVAKKFKIPIRIVLGLTNVVGKDAHKEWLKNAPHALELAAIHLADPF